MTVQQNNTRQFNINTSYSCSDPETFDQMAVELQSFVNKMVVFLQQKEGQIIININASET